jgi:hypothetical protein
MFIFNGKFLALEIRKWNHWMCALLSASVNGSARMFTVQVSIVADTSSPLPLSKALLNWYGTEEIPISSTKAAIVLTRRIEEPVYGLRLGTGRARGSTGGRTETLCASEA